MSEKTHIPPLLPGNSKDFDRAITLLGERGKGHQIRLSRQHELIALIGEYPSPEDSQLYKSSLKKLKKRLVLINP